MANISGDFMEMGEMTRETIRLRSEHNKFISQLIVAKIVAMLVLGFVSFGLGVLPIKLAKWLSWKKEESSPNFIISLLLCFGGGVLLFTTFLHLQPEVREGIEYLQNNGHFQSFKHDFHLAELIFCCGFFFVYLVEEVVHAVLDRRPLEMEDEAVLHRTMSLRRCSKHPTMQEDGNLIPRVNLNSKPKSDISDTSTNQSTGSISASTHGLLHPTCIAISLDKHAPLELRVKAHGHSHAMPCREHDDVSIDSSTVAKSFRGLLAVLALSFHAVFEGLAVGLETSVVNVWYLFAAIATHKLVIAFCVGVELVSSKTRMVLIVIYIATFAAVTPLGIGVGIALSGEEAEQGSVIAVVLQGMAAGTLLYVIFFEVLQRERANTQMGFWQLLAIMAGFAVMFALQLATGHEHSHTGGHSHHHGDDHDHHDFTVVMKVPTPHPIFEDHHEDIDRNH